MTPTLKLGDTGEGVRQLQVVLRSLGFYRLPKVDGVFGPLTNAAVHSFQSSRKLAADGVVGPVTWAALLQPARVAFPEHRCYPLRCLPDGRKPVVTSGHRDRNPDRPTHYGVDLLYAYKHDDPPMRIGDGGRTERWWVPDNTFAIAPFVGRVVIAGDSSTGKRVWLAHPLGWNAGFFHLDQLVVKEGEALAPGVRVGRVAHNPAGGSDPRHLHWELYWGDIVDDVRHGNYPRGTVDPELLLDIGTPYLPAE
jgi:hypothetical protein